MLCYKLALCSCRISPLLTGAAGPTGDVLKVSGMPELNKRDFNTRARWENATGKRMEVVKLFFFPKEMGRIIALGCVFWFSLKLTVRP